MFGIIGSLTIKDSFTIPPFVYSDKLSLTKYLQSGYIYSTMAPQKQELEGMFVHAEVVGKAAVYTVGSIFFAGAVDAIIKYFTQ